MEDAKRKYKPQYAKVVPWNEIEEHFSKWPKDVYKNNIVTLVKHIISTRLSERLFAYTSMNNKLVVSIYDPIEWNREALHIEFDHINQIYNFKYYPKPNEDIEFERDCVEEAGIEKFDNFIKMLKW